MRAPGLCVVGMGATERSGVGVGVRFRVRFTVNGARTPAGALRAQAIGQIGRFRSAVRDALSDTPDQGRAVDKRLFAYLDLLEGLRNRGSNEPTPAPEGPEPAAG